MEIIVEGLLDPACPNGTRGPPATRPATPRPRDEQACANGRTDASVTVPTLSTTASAHSRSRGDVLVLGVAKTDEGPRVLLSDDPALPALQLALESIGVTSAQDELRRVPSNVAATEPRLVGLGTGAVTPDGLGTQRVRPPGGCAVSSRSSSAPAGQHPGEVLAVLEDGPRRVRLHRLPGRVAGGHEAAGHERDRRRCRGCPELITKASVIARCRARTVRDLVNAPPLDLYPETLAARAAPNSPAPRALMIEVLDEGCAARGAGSAASWASGGVRPADRGWIKVAAMRRGRRAAPCAGGQGQHHLQLGRALAEAAGIHGRHEVRRLTGAATVLAVAIAAARLELPIRVTAWLCLAENLPSGTSIRPNDVLRIRGGKTVEVLNTDAEEAAWCSPMAWWRERGASGARSSTWPR